MTEAREACGPSLAVRRISAHAKACASQVTYVTACLRAVPRRRILHRPTRLDAVALSTTVEAGRVTGFVVSYRFRDEAGWHEAVRYESHNGGIRVVRWRRDGPSEPVWLRHGLPPDLARARDRAVQRLLSNWPRYRARYVSTRSPEPDSRR